MQQIDVVIMGAGMSGLCMAIELKRSGQHNFVVLEKSAGLGGTWWDNRYPGAHVDVPAPLYSFSFEPNPRWRRRFAASAEIQAYMAHCAAKYGAIEHIRFDTEVSGARFDEASGRWHITTADGQLLDARFFVCSTGPLSRPRWPEIEGLHSFAGTRLHSARWDAGVPLAGQRVAVIGTGSTAAQLVAPIARQARRLQVFQRTANWVMPRIDRPYHALDRALTRLPLYSRAVRATWRGLLEWGRRGFDEGTQAHRWMQGQAHTHLHRQVSGEALRTQLRPQHALGCKRIIYSNDYYRALTQSHVELVTAGIQSITRDAVLTTDGRVHPADVLVCATGFDVEHSLASLPIQGRCGRLLSSAWADGPQAHLGLTVADFPNLFLMLGPNTATGHTSTLLFIEPGVLWTVKAMHEVQRRGARWISVQAAVQQAFNEGLQERLRNSVWSTCRSWYRAANGRNIAIWPGYTREYVQAVRGQRFGDFDFG